ncbi:penicillin-binding protein 1A [Robiginitalea myxolifaciens]|uniref:Penicillin-binding protein 1A n=1 Tax=Robiginitalea myxolifaciens TaxID=400055 RepID=A0A1I6FNS8_9FLAO|nr:transglycosylase domain-containing protein [Robiginitalea myxolifaciens]SFR31595.1 penicillin-binding protein 1A [Robiginitalea myxolifaciens]
MNRLKTLFLKLPRWARLPVGLFLTATLVVAGFILSVRLGLWGRIPSTNELAEIQLDRATEVYSADSVLIGKYYLNDRQPIPPEAIPGHVTQALIAIEDQRFYQHNGVDYPSLFRVFFKNILLGDSSAGGGSTISQQLAKNLFPRKAGGTIRLVADKVREMIIAGRLEKAYGKEGVLHLYLNTVSFGDNTYGIESASQRFFSRPASQLNTEQAAVLIGMLKATYSYNPRIFPERSTQRRNLVLQNMAKLEYLPPTLADSLAALPLQLQYQPYGHDQGLAPYFREEVRKQAVALIAELPGDDKNLNIYNSGLKIYTTLDSRLQEIAEERMHEHMPAIQGQMEKAYGNRAPWKSDKTFKDAYLRESEPYRKLKAAGISHADIMDSLSRKRLMTLGDWQGEREVEASTADSLLHYARFLQTGNLAIDARSGAVLVWVGGIDYQRFKFDHISQSKRQVGSTFKPIVYTTALEEGLEPCTYFSAREVRYENLEDWTPANSGSDDEAYLNYTLNYALTHSVNTVAVKVLEETGIPRVIAQSEAMGIHEPLPEEPAIALGAGSVPMEQLAAAYSSFVNKGKPATPFLIRRIEDSEGRELFAHQPVINEEAFSEETRDQMLRMMQNVVNEGTASRLRARYDIRGDVAGKTGTTQKNRDAWFVGLTPKVVHISWVGLDRYDLSFPNTTIGQGANAALPLFALWYRDVQNDPELRHWVSGRFEFSEQSEDLEDCPPIKRDGFFKRLFTNPNKAKTRKFRKKEGR